MAVGEPFTECETRHNLDQLQRQGLVDFGSILDADEVEVLGTDLPRKWDDSRMHESEDDQIRGTIPCSSPTRHIPFWHGKPTPTRSTTKFGIEVRLTSPIAPD